MMIDSCLINLIWLVRPASVDVSDFCSYFGQQPINASREHLKLALG